MNESNLLGGDTHSNQLVANIVIDVKRTVVFRSGEVAEHKLRRLLILVLFPYFIDVLYAVVYFTALKIFKHRVKKALVKCRFSSVIGDEKHIILVGFYRSVVDLLGSLGEALHHILLHFARFHLYNVEVCFGCWEVEHICGLNIRHLLKGRHKLGNVKEFGKACLCSVSRTVGSKLDCRNRFSKGGCPRIKVKQTSLLQLVVLEVFLHRIKLYHRVRDRRSGSKYTSLPARKLVKVTALHIEVARLLSFRLRYACHVSHFGIRGKVLIKVRFIDKQAVNTKFLKGHYVILSRLVIELFKFCFKVLLGTFKLLYRHTLTPLILKLGHTYHYFLYLRFNGAYLSFNRNGYLFKL